MGVRKILRSKSYTKFDEKLTTLSPDDLTNQRIPDFRKTTVNLATTR